MLLHIFAKASLSGDGSYQLGAFYWSAAEGIFSGLEFCLVL